MKQLSTYIGYVMGLAGFAGLVWTYASKSADSRYSVASLKGDIENIKASMVKKGDFDALALSFADYVAKSKQTDSAIIKNYNAFRSSWVLYVKNHTRDYDSLLKYFKGIEFEMVVPEKSRTPETKIKITPIEK